MNGYADFALHLFEFGIDHITFCTGISRGRLVLRCGFSCCLRLFLVDTLGQFAGFLAQLPGPRLDPAQ